MKTIDQIKEIICVSADEVEPLVRTIDDLKAWKNFDPIHVRRHYLDSDVKWYVLAIDRKTKAIGCMKDYGRKTILLQINSVGGGYGVELIREMMEISKSQGQDAFEFYAYSKFDQLKLEAYYRSKFSDFKQFENVFSKNLEHGQILGSSESEVLSTSPWI